jgi:hypothetical protein
LTLFVDGQPHTDPDQPVQQMPTIDELPPMTDAPMHPLAAKLALKQLLDMRIERTQRSEECPVC